MRWIFVFLISFAALTSCDTTPVRRVHSAASIPRVVDINPAEFLDGEPTAFGAQAGLGYGAAYSDVGNVHGSAIGMAGFNFRSKHFAGGFLPYFGSARVHHEGTDGLGAIYWAAYHFGGGQIWRFSAQSTIGYMSKVAEEKGCSNDTGFIFGSVCTKAPESRTRAEVKATEIGLIFTAEKRVSKRGSFLLAPAAYWTKVDTGNQLDTDTINNYDRHLRAWNPGIQFGYIIRQEDGSSPAFAFMAGAQWAKYFSATKTNRVILPMADIRLIF